MLTIIVGKRGESKWLQEEKHQRLEVPQQEERQKGEDNLLPSIFFKHSLIYLLVLD